MKLTTFITCVLVTVWAFNSANRSAAADKSEPLGAAAPSGIIVTNYKDGEEIRYPVALLRGTLTDKDARQIVSTNETSKRKSRVIHGCARAGQFKVLAELLPGKNTIELKAGKLATKIHIHFKPQTSDHIVRMIYMTGAEGITNYQAPKGHTIDFKSRLGTAAKLMQTMTAERMKDMGLGRRTFNLELDAEGKVKVHIFKGKLKTKDYYALADGTWWVKVARELEPIHPTRKAKNIVIAAYTRFDPKTKKVQGHTALGGGGLGLFGSGNLYTWPASLDQVHAAFTDSTPVDGRKFHNDSSGRNNYWGAASTTIGATIHEMGHTFGLAHTTRRYDIMTRGFDYFHRVFTLADAPSGRNRTERTFKPTDQAAFGVVSAYALRASRWFAHDKRQYDKPVSADLRWDDKTKQLVVSSKHGVRYIGINVKGNHNGANTGTQLSYVAPASSQPAPKEIALPYDKFRKSIKADQIRLNVIDDQGITTFFYLKNMRDKLTPTIEKPTRRR